MTIRKETSAYNQRRYGAPWIAKVDFSSNAKGDYSFGDWVGDKYNGTSGILTIDAASNTIVAIGQKDFRQPRNSAPTFYYVSDSGELVSLGDKKAAYEYYLANKSEAPSTEELLKEREDLLARLSEIEALLSRESA